MPDTPLDPAGQISFASEIARKATHLGALVFPCSYYLFQWDKWTMLSFMVPLALAMFVIDVARLRQWSIWRSSASVIVAKIIRGHEKAGDFTGATYILSAVCVTIALYDKTFAIAALAFIAVGDSFAALAGRKFGRHKLGKPFGNKSWEGSAACLFGTTIVALLVPGLDFSVGLFGALVAAIAEAMPFGIDDNVTVPLLSGLAMTLFAAITSTF